MPKSMLLLFSVTLSAVAIADAPAAKPVFERAGPFPVGVRTIVIVDSSRQDEYAGGSRTLVTEIWYPAGESARGQPRTKFAEYFGPFHKEGSKALKRDLDEIDRGFDGVSVRGAEMRDGRWPLLVFSHGNGGFRHQNVFQVEHLASHGYVIASPDHTGNASLTPLPGKPLGYDKKGRNQSAMDRPLDVRFLITALLAAEDPEARWLARALDPDRVGALGHSFGGFTAVKAVEQDPRIKAIVPMTVAFVATPTAVPTLVMLAAHDGTVGRAGNFASRGYYLGLKGARNLFVLKRGGHFSFTEMALINPLFGDGIGRGKGLDGAPMEYLGVGETKRIVNAYTLAFFERHLRASAPAESYLAENHFPNELEWWVGDREVKADGASAAAADTPPSRERKF